MRTDRITPQHLQRTAIVYVRQSSPEQVRSHAESTRIQVGLRDQAVAFGWPKPATIVDDLGVSAAGFAHRPGFQHLVAEVSLGHVGMILCFEASRLSRNSKDWAQLFELCGLLATLVADLDQVYDLSLPDDRLILGVNSSRADRAMPRYYHSGGPFWPPHLRRRQTAGTDACRAVASATGYRSY